MLAIAFCSAGVNNPIGETKPFVAEAPDRVVDIEDLETAASAAAQPQIHFGHIGHVGGHRGHLHGGSLDRVRIGGPGGFRAVNGHRFRFWVQTDFVWEH